MVILVGGKFLSTLGEVMESALGTLSSWATNCSLGINSNKADLVETVRLPKLGDRELPLSSEVKYLGVVLDSKLEKKHQRKNK